MRVLAETKLQLESSCEQTAMSYLSKQKTHPTWEQEPIQPVVAYKKLTNVGDVEKTPTL